MLFCPCCANILLVQSFDEGQKFFCQTCPYAYSITGTHTSRKKFQRKEVDDVLGGESAFEGKDSTEVICPKCEHTQAYFFQIQIRSADEPMTTFYRCCKCGNQWREN